MTANELTEHTVLIGAFEIEHDLGFCWTRTNAILKQPSKGQWADK